MKITTYLLLEAKRGGGRRGERGSAKSWRDGIANGLDGKLIVGNREKLIL